jgi:ligand-binding sensor domain-containing protein
MKHISIVFNLILTLSFSGPTYAAQARLSKSTLSSQIDQPVIAAIYRDKSGLLWIGTQEGLYKFDGPNPILFNSDGNNENWIPSSDIRGIAEDIDGSLLVATHGGGL